MKRFAELIDELDRTNRTSDKTAAIEAYFRAAPPADAAWALQLLSGRRLKRAVKSSVMWTAAAKHTGVPDWLLEECREAVGDFSETVALLLPSDRAHEAAQPDGLAEVMRTRVLPLASLDDDKAEALLRDSWERLGPGVVERFVYNKLVRGSFRVGASRGLVLRGLAAAIGVDAKILEHRFGGSFKPTPEAFLALAAPDDGEDARARPYPFCLAQQLDQPTDALGPLEDWYVDYKWDGIRAQVIRREQTPLLWSRGEELVGAQFPEIVSAARALPMGTVLDGEILAWDTGPRDRPLSFAALQTRLNRKDVQPGLFDQSGAVLVVFDLLEHEGVDIRDRSLAERLELLAPLLERAQKSTGGTIRAGPRVQAASWEDVATRRTHARVDMGAEGVMLKHRVSRYHVGRVAGITKDAADPASGGWWKWKIDPYAVDAVLMCAQLGSGKRAGLFTDYTFGVWDPDAATGALTPFAKAYSGLTDAEIREVDAFIRQNIVGRMGPVRVVRPELVFEVSFEGIAPSTRHRSGVGVRFPRITRWRTDKKPQDADTIAMVRSLIPADARAGAPRRTGRSTKRPSGPVNDT